MSQNSDQSPNKINGWLVVACMVFSLGCLIVGRYSGYKEAKSEAASIASKEIDERVEQLSRQLKELNREYMQIREERDRLKYSSSAQQAINERLARELLKAEEQLKKQSQNAEN